MVFVPHCSGGIDEIKDVEPNATSMHGIRRCAYSKDHGRQRTVPCAGTHLNICAILSKLEKHDKASLSFTLLFFLQGSVFVA